MKSAKENAEVISVPPMPVFVEIISSLSAGHLLPNSLDSL